MNPHVQRVLVLFEQHRFGEAELEIQHLLGLNPHDATAHAMAGLCLYLQHRDVDAVAHARESLRLAPNMAGYDTVTRVLLNHCESGQAHEPVGYRRQQGWADMITPEPASFMGVAPSRVDFLAPTAEIEAFLERWQQFLETSKPELVSLHGPSRKAGTDRRCAGRAAAVRKPVSLLSQIRPARCDHSGHRQCKSRPSGARVGPSGTYRSRPD